MIGDDATPAGAPWLVGRVDDAGYVRDSVLVHDAADSDDAIQQGRRRFPGATRFVAHEVGYKAFDPLQAA